MCEPVTHDGMIEKADSQTLLDTTCNSDDFVWNSVGLEESAPKTQGIRI